MPAPIDLTPEIMRLNVDSSVGSTLSIEIARVGATGIIKSIGVLAETRSLLSLIKAVT